MVLKQLWHSEVIYSVLQLNFKYLYKDFTSTMSRRKLWSPTTDPVVSSAFQLCTHTGNAVIPRALTYVRVESRHQHQRLIHQLVDPLSVGLDARHAVFRERDRRVAQQPGRV